jgi:hypothetical protein
MSVATSPGAMALQVIPLDEKTLAVERVRLMSPALAAA